MAKVSHDCHPVPVTRTIFLFAADFLLISYQSLHKMRQALLLRPPLSFPLFRSTPPPCPTCVRRRTLSTTAPLSVFRPQEPYEFPKPRLDSLGKPMTTRRRPIDESSEEDALWDQQVKESGKPDPIEQMLAEMAEPTRKGFYERYGSHDGYGLRNKQRWRMGEDGKLEPWDGAGANWKETLGFRPNLPRPGRRVEVPGFQHRKSPKLEVNGRGRYVQVEGGSWGVKKAISGSSGYGVDSDRVEAGDGQGIVGRRSDDNREMKREWTGEGDFLRADDDLVEPYHRTRRQDLPRPLPPHLDVQNDGEMGEVRTTPSSTTSSSFFNDPASDRSTDRPSSSVRQGRPPRLSFSDRNITSGTPTPRLPNASTADIEGYQNRSARAPRLPRTFGVRHYTSGSGFAMPPKLKGPARPATSTSPSQSHTPSASASRPAALKVEGDNGPAPLNASQTPATYSNSRSTCRAHDHPPASLPP